MNIIEKYIYREFLIPFLYCFFLFVLIFIMGDLFENLDAFIMHKTKWAVILKYYLIMIPSVFVLTAPLAVLLAILYQLGYMSRYNEITALKASGVSFWRIITPFWSAGIMLSCLLFIINEKMVPQYSAELNHIKNVYIAEKKTGIKDKTAADGKNVTFFSSLYNTSFYVDKLNVENNTASAVSVREFYGDGSLKREWYGKTGRWLDSAWWLFEGYIRNYKNNGRGKVETIFFKKQEIPAEITPEDLLHSRRDIEKVSAYMNFAELHSYIKRNFKPNAVPRDLIVDLYRKLSVPITLIIVALFGIAFGSRISKGGAMASVGISLGFYLIYYGTTSLFLAMGKIGSILPCLAVWTPQILFGTISVLILRRTR